MIVFIFILAGDKNELKLGPITLLSPMMNQIVLKPTRQNPPRILDPILTTISNFYQTPEILAPLDDDPDKNGTPSDHNIVVFEQIFFIKTTCAREKRKIIVRPMPQNKLEELKEHFKCENWQKLNEL